MLKPESRTGHRNKQTKGLKHQFKSDSIPNSPDNLIHIGLQGELLLEPGFIPLQTWTEISTRMHQSPKSSPINVQGGKIGSQRSRPTPGLKSQTYQARQVNAKHKGIKCIKNHHKITLSTLEITLKITTLL